jgi:energy-coupling factor transport system ATP-binding protein
LNIAIKDLHFTYPSGVEALRGISLTLESGAQVAIVGQNGAGKTTLVKHFNGLLQPTSGQVLIGDWDTKEHSVAKLARRVGYVFQNPDEQLFSKTVGAEVAFGPRNLGFNEEQVQALVRDALALTELSDKTETNPYDLSATWRKMVAIASILSMDTRIVVFDEPTTGQDAASVIALQMSLRSSERAVKQSSPSHDIDFCKENSNAYCDVTGQILLDGAANDVLGRRVWRPRL